MSDNAMFNFGKLLDEIVIIDAGSRPLVPNLMSKSEFNKTCMVKFWNKVQLTIEKSELDVCRIAWQQANDMDSARTAFDELWGSMHGAMQRTSGSAEQPAPKAYSINDSGAVRNRSRSAEQRAHKLDSGKDCDAVRQLRNNTKRLTPVPDHLDSGAEDTNFIEQAGPAPNTACPHVAALLECVSTESLDWLVQYFLWGKVSNYTLSCDGTLAFNQGRGQVSADIKLELLIKLTRERRETFCANTNMDILTEDELQIVLKDWKSNYKQWIHPETLRRSYSLTQQGWHQMLRKSFRSFLFHLVGCYEMSIFFLVAPFTPDNLDLFRLSWEQSTTNEGALALSKRLARPGN
jgi:hypothetical protein